MMYDLDAEDQRYYAAARREQVPISDAEPEDELTERLQAEEWGYDRQ